MTRRPAQGILPYQQITRLITAGTISAPTPIEDRQIQPASLDLRLGKKAYRLISSFLPNCRPSPAVSTSWIFTSQTW